LHKPDDSFQVLYQHNFSCQEKYLEKLEQMNRQRQDTQSDILKEAEEQINKDENILLAI
jgi:single-stranded DNA-specific DHH superfamily exonuclease